MLAALDGSEVALPVEMIGWIVPCLSSEVVAPSGPPFNADVIATTARTHENADFDRVLIGYFSDAPDGFLIGAHAATVTKRLGPSSSRATANGYPMMILSRPRSPWLDILIQKGPLDPGHPIVVSADGKNAHCEPPERMAEWRFHEVGCCRELVASFAQMNMLAHRGMSRHCIGV